MNDNDELNAMSGTVIDVAKLTRLTLPRGLYIKRHAATPDGSVNLLASHSLLAFAVEGRCDYAITVPAGPEAEEVAAYAKQIHDETGTEIHVAHRITFSHPIILITPLGWETFPCFAYYCEGEGVVEMEPERGIAADMAKMMFHTNDIASESAEISERARRVNIHLAMAVAFSAAERIGSGNNRGLH